MDTVYNDVYIYLYIYDMYTCIYICICICIYTYYKPKLELQESWVDAPDTTRRIDFTGCSVLQDLPQKECMAQYPQNSVVEKTPTWHLRIRPYESTASWE